MSVGRKAGGIGDRYVDEISVIVGPRPSLGATEGDRGELTISGVSMEA